MGTVIKLRERGEGGLSESVDDRLDSRYLADEPLSSYVGEDEQVAFVLVNKRGGVTVEREGESETYKPGRKFRTFVAVTDVRMLVAVGGADGDSDRIVSIPLWTITDVATESSFLGGALVVRTDADEEWSIPCRDDLDPVVAYLEAAQRAWSKADRFLAEVDDRIEAADAYLDEGAYETALETAADAISVIVQSRERLGTFEMGDGVVTNADFESREADIRTVQRRAHAGIAAAHRATAHEHRDNEQFREAHEYLERSRESYDRALAVTASEPPEEVLTERRREIERELTALERRPAAAAADALDEARGVDDPVERAAKLTDALDRHRDLLGLCWGPDAPFKGETDAIRERIVDIVDELVAARIDTAKRLVAAADRLAVRDHPEEALTECDRADEQIEAAHAVASELAPERVDAVEEWQCVVDDQRERITSPETTEERRDGEADVSTATETEASVAMRDPDEERTTTETEPTADTETQDQATLTELAADLWRSHGWQTTVSTESGDQYDIMATREELIDIRVFVWTIDRPDDDLDMAVVDRCATDRSNVTRADIATIVTTATVPDEVRERATEHNVKIIDSDRLRDLLDDESASLLDG